MMDSIKDFLYTFSRRLKLKKLSVVDYSTNMWLKARWNFIRRWRKRMLKNSSSLHKNGYKLTFVDNFDKVNWDMTGTNKWKIGESWGLVHHKKPNVYYGAPKMRYGKAFFTCEYKPKEFTVKGEKMVVPYEVSLLSSEKWFKQKFGRFECRMTLPDAPHSWPAFWMYGPTWPPEIDVIETLGKNTGKSSIYQEINMHFGFDHDNTRTHLRPWITKIDEPSGLGKNFYEFAVEWSPDKIEFFTNGIKIFQYTDKDIISKYFSSGPMWVVINNSIRNYNEHNPDYKSEFQVDYIRVYNFI